MRALPRARPTPSHAARSRAGVWLATELVLVVLATALAVTLHRVLPASWSAWGSVPPQALGLALVVGGLVLLLTRGLASAQRRKQVGDPLEDQADQAEVEASAPDDPAAPAADPAQLRDLRAQVRSLEQALDLETRRVAELRALLEAGQGAEHDTGGLAGQDGTGQGLQQVRATIRGLARRSEGDAVAAEVLARVEAALARLSTPSAFARPVLTRAGAATTGTAPSPGELLMHDHHPVPDPGAGSAEAPPGAVPAGVPGGLPDEAAAPPEPQHAEEHHPGAGAPEREVVLPVPPREDPEAGGGQRGRRWFRRHAA